MERFLALLRLLQRRRGRRYRAADDYQEGYDDVYFYTSKYRARLLREWHTCNKSRCTHALGKHTHTHLTCTHTHAHTHMQTCHIFTSHTQTQVHTSHSLHVNTTFMRACVRTLKCN